MHVAGSEISADYLGVGDDFLGRPFGDLLTMIEHNDVTRHRHDGAHHMLDDDDGQSAL